jgi:ankyrin repeat protein
LFIAAAQGHEDIVQLLLDNHAMVVCGTGVVSLIYFLNAENVGFSWFFVQWRKSAVDVASTEKLRLLLLAHLDDGFRPVVSALADSPKRGAP